MATSMGRWESVGNTRTSVVLGRAQGQSHNSFRHVHGSLPLSPTRHKHERRERPPTVEELRHDGRETDGDSFSLLTQSLTSGR